MAHWTDKLLESPGFCTRPFFHLYLNPLGGTNVCCNNIEYSYGNINDSSFEHVFSKDNPKLVDFRREFIESNQLPESCRLCRDNQRVKYKNDHIKQTKKFLRQFDTVDDLINNEKIYTYDVRFNNLCNLKCHYCTPQGSSRIAFQHYKQGRPVQVFETLPNENIQQILQRFEDSIENVTEFYFAGGEPLIMKEHYQILDICVKHKRYDIILSYNSNLTKLGTKKYNAIDYWQHFNHIGLSASIDAGWQQFEFIRSGAVWDEVVENFKILRTMPNIGLTIAPTIAFWNMLGLPKVYKYLVENNLLDRQTHGFGGEILRHEYLRPAVLPKEYKEHIMNVYATEYRDYPEISSLAKYFEEDLSHLLPQTKRHIQMLSQRSNCDFNLIFPEFKDLFTNVP